MSEIGILAGRITFIQGASIDDVGIIAEDLSQYIGARPETALRDQQYMAIISPWPPLHSVITYDEPGKRALFTLHYKFILPPDWWYDVSDDVKKCLIRHANKIKEVHLALYTVDQPETAIDYDHDTLINKRVEQISKQLLGEDDEDE